MMQSQQQNHRQRDQLSLIIDELSALVMKLLRSLPTSTSFADRSPMPTKITAVGFGWLMLGISVSLMLFGSVTFFLGFILMPWVIGLLMFSYVAGIVSAISMMGRWILCHVIAPPSPIKDITEYLSMICDCRLEAYVKTKGDSHIEYHGTARGFIAPLLHKRGIKTVNFKGSFQY